MELESTEQSLHLHFFPRAIGMFHQDFWVGIVHTYRYSAGSENYLPTYLPTYIHTYIHTRLHSSEGTRVLQVPTSLPVGCATRLRYFPWHECWANSTLQYRTHYRYRYRSKCRSKEKKKKKKKKKNANSAKGKNHLTYTHTYTHTSPTPAVTRPGTRPLSVRVVPLAAPIIFRFPTGAVPISADAADLWGREIWWAGG